MSCGEISHRVCLAKGERSGEEGDVLRYYLLLLWVDRLILYFSGTFRCKNLCCAQTTTLNVTWQTFCKSNRKRVGSTSWWWSQIFLAHNHYFRNDFAVVLRTQTRHGIFFIPPTSHGTLWIVYCYSCYVFLQRFTLLFLELFMLLLFKYLPIQ